MKLRVEYHSSMRRMVQRLRRRPGAAMIVGALAFLLTIAYALSPGWTAPETVHATSTEQGAGHVYLLLAPHQLVKQEISQEQVHTYQITLDSGKYAHVMMECRGLKIGVALIGPDGQRRAESDCRETGPTPISLITDGPGSYRLEVRAQEQNSLLGHYLAELKELRPATTLDRNRIAAERAAVEAARLRDEFRAEASRQAINKYEEALQQWRAAGERREEAQTLKNIGEVYQSLGETQASFRHYHEALLLSRKVNDLRGEGEVLNDLGYLHFSLGDNQQALENCTRALRLSRSARNRQGEAQALSGIGDAHYGSGDFHKALELYEEALQLRSELDDRRGQAKTLTSLGYAYDALSETQKAFDFYHQALSLWRSVNDRRGLAQTLTALSFLQSKVGEMQKALNSYNEALQFSQSMGDRNMEAPLLSGIAYTYAALGENQKALSHYNQALAIYQALNDRWGEAAVQLTIGMVYQSLEETDKALNFYQEALATFQALNMPRPESHVLREIGLVYDSSGDKRKSLDYYQRSLALTQLLGDRREEAYTLNYIGRVYESLGQTPRALDYYQRALPLNQAAGDRYGESSTLYNIARAERDRGHLNEACSRMELALGIIESLRTKVASQGLRTSYFASVQQHYELYIDLLMQMHRQRPDEGFGTTALEASERARARSLLETLMEARADIKRGTDSALLERERSLQQLLNAKAERQMSLLGGKHTEDEAAAIAKEIDDITAEYDDVRAQIRATNPHYAALTQPRPLRLKEIQQQVLDGDDQALLLEYALGDERSYLWAVTRDGISGYELPGRAKIEAAARRVYELLKAHQPVPGEALAERQARATGADAQYWQEADALSRMILGPVAGQLGNKRLLIVADGALQYVPFAALTVPDAERQAQARAQETARAGDPTPLIMDHEIVNLPSASTLAGLRRETAQRTPAPNTIAVLADPVFEKDDPRIPAPFRAQGSARVEQSAAAEPTEVTKLQQAVRDAGVPGTGGSIPRLLASREEAEAIMQLTPAGAGLKAIGFDASRATATSSELSKYRIVHFATHGLLNSEQPELSGVILSLVDRQGQPQNGFLRMHDIYNLNLPADLVVLSACNTGLGKDVKGEGLIGLTRGFMYAGASGVMASLWKVDDEATAELMRQFYRGLLKDGLPPSAALRRAQVMMWKQKSRRSPYYWAAFVLQGEYRERIDLGDHAQGGTRRIVAAGATMLVFSIGGGLYARKRRRRNAMRASALGK